MKIEKSSVPSVERTVTILEYLGEQPNPISLKDISVSLKLPNASVFRIVKYLVGAGYIAEHTGTITTYSLGLKILQLAQKTLSQIDLSEVSRDLMRNLAEKTSQTCQLAVLLNEKVMYIDQVFPPSYPVSIIAPLHSPLAVNLSATGKILYAYQDTQELERLLAIVKLQKGTEKSITDMDFFRKDLIRVRNEGFGTDTEEFAAGIGCIGAPIFDHNKKITAAIGLTGHIRAYSNPIDFERIKELTLETADKISARLGYQKD